MKTLIILIITFTALLFAISFSSNSFGDDLSLGDNCVCCDSKCIESKCCEDNCCGSGQGVKSGCAENCPVDLCKECCKGDTCNMKTDSGIDHGKQHRDHDLSSGDLQKACCITKAENDINGNCCK